MKQKLLSGAERSKEGLSLSDIKFKGKVPDFRGQLRCHIGYDHQNRDICILIPPEQLAEKQKKHPKLHVIGTV